jgi:pSer/pThr/pTyr-binding forkhead associated (FHA) protein
VAFVLRVTQGGEGEEFSFDSEARLGRTADNDVVIKDPASSRSHARVYEQAGQYYVEDLKSANGTQLNRGTLKGPKVLKSGDQIGIGDTVIEFSVPVVDSTMMALDDVDGPVDANATMLRPAAAPIVKAKPPPRRPTSRPSSPGEPVEPAPDDGSTRNFEPAAPRTLSRRTGSTPARVRPPEGEAEPESALSAAEKARQRRELQKSSAGRLRLLWLELSKPARIVASLVLGSIALGSLAFIAFLAFPKTAEKRVEPLDLKPNTDPITFSFGLGPDVDFARPDMKSFTFSFASPTRVVGVLHYQSKGISKGEVTIEMNGAEVGAVPADLLDSDTREQDVVLPATSVKLGEPNEVVFDNVNNPPADDPWKIWNIWVELTPIPEMSAEEAARRAKDDMERASKYYELRGVGAANLFRAWKTYREVWLLLEATPDSPRNLHEISRTRMREIRPELDRKCSTLLVEYQKVMSVRDPDYTTARKILEDIPSSFPTREHPCHTRGRALLRDLEWLPEEGR